MKCTFWFLIGFSGIVGCTALEDAVVDDPNDENGTSSQILDSLFDEDVLIYSDGKEISYKNFIQSKNFNEFTTVDQMQLKNNTEGLQHSLTNEEKYLNTSLRPTLNEIQLLDDQKPPLTPINNFSAPFQKTASRLLKERQPTVPMELQSITKFKEPAGLISDSLSPDAVFLTTPKKSESDQMTSDNDTCHTTCVSLLDKMAFRVIPKSFLVRKGSSISFECSIPFEFASAIHLIWLFQRNDPPSPQCSLTPHDSLTLCSHFLSVEHITDTNFTTKIAKEKITLSLLNDEDSGYYYCSAELFCCPPDPHVMQRTIKTDYPVQIYEENYVLELGILSGILSFLIIVFVTGTYLMMKRRRQKAHRSFLKIDIVGYEDVLHAPILGTSDDSDSFEESDNEA